MGIRRQAMWITYALACVTATHASGDDGEIEPSLADLSLEQLLATQVTTASFVLDDRLDQPVSMTIITREEIEQSGARTLDELLGLLVPGFFLVEDQDDTIAAFRGFAPDNNSKVLFQIDGRALNTEWFWGPPDALLNGIDLGWIERVEVIRGPGSVTLGQGALLGVINVITRTPGAAPYTHVSMQLGTDALVAGRFSAGFRDDQLSTAFYLSGTSFDGSPMRDVGWAREQENPIGLSVHDRGHRLKGADQTLALAHVAWRDLTMAALYVGQTRDNYNFYRDREAIEQRLLALTATWKRELPHRLELTVRAGYDRDELGQRSLSGMAMAGTREDRVSGLALLGSDDVLGYGRLVVGAEAKHVAMGLPDRNGQNLIVNDAGERASATNASHTYVERSDALGGALLAEHALEAGRLTTFAGLRYDLHQQWGHAWSPRLGALLEASQALRLRVGIHSGFRGAVGVHYAGGFRRDGLLSEESFDQIDDNPALAGLGFDDLPRTVPERKTSTELGARHQLGQHLELDGVVFVDRVTHVIDVGVIFVGDQLDGAPPEQRQIGDDVIGDWGGWFFFKNNPGTITSGGSELSLRWKSRRLDARASYAHARVIDLDRAQDQIGSMYIAGTAGDPHFRAFPEHVGRVSARVRPAPYAWASTSIVAFGRWFAPAGDVTADGAAGAWMDLAAGFRMGSHVTTSLTIKNVTDARLLWPMNSNAGDPSRSAGTPALEPRSVWLTFGVDR